MKKPIPISTFTLFFPTYSHPILLFTGFRVVMARSAQGAIRKYFELKTGTRVLNKIPQSGKTADYRSIAAVQIDQQDNASPRMATGYEGCIQLNNAEEYLWYIPKKPKRK